MNTDERAWLERQLDRAVLSRDCVAVNRIARRLAMVQRNSIAAQVPPPMVVETRTVETVAVKAVDAGQRTIAGWASTGAVDRIGDCVLPEGCKYRAPLPILWAHRRDQPPIGKITTVKPSSKGVWVEGRIARIERAGMLRDLVDMVWDAVVGGLVTAFSIGFWPIKSEPIAGGKGLKYVEWELLETSLVGVPANSDCSITNVAAVS